MANAVTVGDLVVRLIADAKQLDTALSKGSADFRKFGNEAEKANKQAQRAGDGTARAITGAVSRITALATAFVSVNAVIGAFNREMANTTQIDQLSQVTGVATTSLAEMRGVLLQLGIDFDSFRQVLTQFAPRMQEALQSPTSKGAQALRALGVEVRDAQGNLRSLDQLLPEFADKFSQYSDGLNKAALASAILGEEAGPRLIPLLNKGKDGIEQLRQAVRGTFTAEDVQRAREYQETVGKLQLAFEAFFREFARSAGPAVIDVLTKLTTALNNMRVPSTFKDELDGVNRQIAQANKEVSDLMNGLFVPDDSINRPFQWLNILGDRVPEIDEIFGRIRDKNREIAELMERQALLTQRAAGEFTTTVTPATRQAPAMDPFALEKAQLALEKIMDRLSGQRDIFDEINYSWEEHSRVVQEALHAIERANEQKHRREAALHRINMQMRRAEQEGMLQTASAAASAISALWPKQKGAAIAAAIINTGVAITRALAGPPGPPWTFAIAALTAVQGAAQIAAIQSTNEDGSGGGGGSISAPPPAEPQADFGRSLTIQGVDPGSIFSGGQVRGLIEMINEEVRNGATLISSGRLQA
jgi:hypothetical protein